MMSRKSSNKSWLKSPAPLAVGAAGSGSERSGARAVHRSSRPTRPARTRTRRTGPNYRQPCPTRGSSVMARSSPLPAPRSTSSITTRAKAVALNPTGNGTAAVLQMGAPQSVIDLLHHPDRRCAGGPTRKASHAELHPSAPTAAAPSASPIRRMARTCCLARTAATGQPTLPSPASIRRRACSQTTPRSAFRWTSTPAAI